MLADVASPTNPEPSGRALIAVRSTVLVLALLGLASCSLAHAGTFQFTWDAPASTPEVVVDGYHMYQSQDNGATFKLILCDEAVQDPALGKRLCTVAPPVNVALCYQVTAYNTVGESPPSNRLCFNVPAHPPGAPGSLRRAGT